MNFSLFTSKLSRFWILHSNWVRLDLFHIILHYGLFSWKGYCYYYSFTDVFVAVVINILGKVSVNIECFKNFLPFTISGAQSKEPWF